MAPPPVPPAGSPGVLQGIESPTPEAATPKTTPKGGPKTRGTWVIFL